MQLRNLGHSVLRVAPLCLGGNVFGWTATEAASFAVLDALVDAGLNFIDTADVYLAWLPGHRGGESKTNGAFRGNAGGLSKVDWRGQGSSHRRRLELHGRAS